MQANDSVFIFLVDDEFTVANIIFSFGDCPFKRFEVNVENLVGHLVLKKKTNINFSLI